MAVGRDYAPLFPFALEALSEDTLIGGNVRLVPLFLRFGHPS